MRRRVIAVIEDAGLRLTADAPFTSLATAEIIELAVSQGASMEVLTGIWDAVTDEETRGMELATVEEDAAHTLRVLKDDGILLALLTNNARDAALAALERFDLLEHLDLVLARDDVTALKPSPVGLELARDQLVSDGRLAMVGDATIDGIAANRASVPFIAFRPNENDMDRRNVVRWSTIQALSDVHALLTALRTS